MFKDEHGKTYLAFIKSESTKDMAIKSANAHFKTKKDNLRVQSGRILENGDLEVGVRGGWWVVSRKERA